MSNSNPNLLSSPLDFGIAPWFQDNSTGLNIISTTELAPDGTNSAYKFSYKRQYALTGQTFTLIPGETYTVSIYAKSAVDMAIVFNDVPYTTGWAFTNYGLATGIVQQGSSGTISTSITSAANGFYRCSATFVAPADKPNAQINFFLGGYNGDDWTGQTMTLWKPSLTLSHAITNNGVALSNNVPTTFAPQSLQLVQSQTDYLDVAASSDWALSRTWTIEFWSKAAKVSGESDLLTVMCQDYTDGNGIQIIYQGGSFEIQGTNRIAAEPTPGQWTHVALVNTVADGMTLYYNGVSQYTGGYWSLANNTAPIRIGARGTADFQRFDGNLAMIRISNTAKYTAAFTPTTTYGVESDTKLFLGTAVPLIDAKGHAITNHGVTTSSSAPQSLTGHPHPFNGGTFGSAYSVFGDPDIVAFSAVPVGARITSNIPNFGIRTVTSSQTNPVGWILTYDNTGLTGLTSTSDVFNFYW